ncbi:phage baseplate plug family protein [Serratia sp. D1N4]
MIEIALTADNQRFRITLGGIEYQMTLLWRNSAGWILDIASSTGTSIVNGIPLVTGANLLQPYKHLGFNGALVVASDVDIYAAPTKDNLGSSGHVYFIAG